MTNGFASLKTFVYPKKSPATTNVLNGEDFAMENAFNKMNIVLLIVARQNGRALNQV
jgi:hypothetical protein